MARILQAMQDALARLLFGRPLGLLQKANDTPWQRWSPEDFARARTHLEALAPEAYTLDDWLLASEFIMQSYLPDGTIETMADYLAWRAGMTGRVQAALAQHAVTAAQAAAIAMMIPARPGRLARLLSPTERSVMEIAHARAVLHVTDLADATRRRMKGIVVRHVEQQLAGDSTEAKLQQQLFDDFGQLNRDWRRIAVTEIGEACTQGFVAAQPRGQQVERIESYAGACEFCSALHGKVFNVVAPNAPDRDGQTDIWEGKTNVGRSASPMKRVGDKLVPRTPDELWWPAAGLQHPNCRGAWHPVTALPPNVSPEFHAWASGLLDAAIKAP